MVYMAGDNYLDHNGFADLLEMKKVGSTREVALIAQFSRGIKGRPTKRYYLRKDKRDGMLASDVVEDLGETNAADPQAFENFVRWGTERFPARRYMLVVWGHGSGVDDEIIPHAVDHPFQFGDGSVHLQASRRAPPDISRGGNSQQSRGIAIGPTNTAFEGVTVDFLDNIKFKKALEAVKEIIGRELDILGMDACLMSGAEVCYQVRGVVRFTVAPEGFGPLDGWPYDKILAELVKRPEIEPENLACTIVDKYVASYADYEDVSVSQSACDLRRCGILVDAVNRLAELLLKRLAETEVKRAVLLSRWQSQSYAGTEYVDLYDFCHLLHDNCGQAEVKSACREVMSAIGPAGFVLKSGYRGTDAQYSYGLSIYFPQHEVSRFYQRLDFARDTHWNEFLNEYVSQTRRPDRSG
jgi:hypothetical protein